MWRALIVDDSSDAAALLRRHLVHFAQEQGEQFSTQILTSAFDFAGGKYAADVVFVDIDLPGIGGMEAARFWRLTDESTPLVFVINLAQFAMEGYKVQALDFLLKPVTYRDFKLCMARVLALMERNVSATAAPLPRR